nr:tannase/feruloyl esterase family alpha/beta hydrolase [Novosphingobium hassiacum]
MQAPSYRSAQTAVPTPTAASFTQRCAELQGATIAATTITLPTTGAAVQSATLVGATASTPEYCKVVGIISPVDPQAPPIKFQTNLPSSWNNKAMQFAGGGFNGIVRTGLDNVVHAPSQSPTPLDRGYATFGSDSGHTGTCTPQSAPLGPFCPLVDATFGMNEEAFVNFTSASLRKTLDVAQSLMIRFYGSAPTKQYINGGSGGGGESLAAVSLWPEKYSGAIVYYPGINTAAGVLNNATMFKKLYGANAVPGSYINPAKQAMIRTKALAICDPMDGAADQLISNPDACEAKFPVDSLRCPDGADTGDTCLSDAQMKALGTVRARNPFPFELNNEKSMAGYMVFGGPATIPYFGATPDYRQNFNANGSQDPIRYFVTRKPDENIITHDPTFWVAQWKRFASLKDSMTTAANANVARRKGVKILMVTGVADSIIGPQVPIDYYTKIVKLLGLTATRDFFRFYIIPGFAHGAPGPVGGFQATFDSLPVLEAWAEGGTAPALGSLITTDARPSAAGRTRPLCDFPSRPVYRGTGDLNLAASFKCVAP